MAEDREKNIVHQLQEIAEEVCDNLCKYRVTSDDEGICDYAREHERCPLDYIT